MPKSRTTLLAEARRARCLIRFSTRFEKATVRGYMLDIGPKFFLMALVSDRIWFDGLECFRTQDVRNIRADPYAGFVETALRKRGERRPKKPRVSLASIEKLLLSAGREFPLVTIQLEQADPGVCWIGKVLRIEHGRVFLREIRPDASWREKPGEYRLSQITRVSFGCDYENALHLVGGRSPATCNS